MISFLGPQSSASAQRLPVVAGNRVRVAAVDSAALSRWREGSVLAATSRGVLLSGGFFGPDTVPLALDASIRLQVRRKNPSFLVGGALGGLALGVGAGALAPSNTLGSWWGEKTPGHRAEMVYFGLAGAVVGWTASWLFAPARWQEVRLTSQGLASPVVALTRPAGRPARFGRLERWDAFSPTEGDFAAFFWAHRDSLHEIEGLWERLPRATADDRIAIVRDARYAGWEYVAVSLPDRSMALDLPRGQVVWALRRRSEPGTFDLVEVENSNLAQGRALDALIQNDVLRIRTLVIEWARVPLAPPR